MSESRVLTAQEVRELFEYNNLTGELKWKTTGKGRKLNKIAGSKDRHGYLQTRIHKKIYFNHRLIWLHVYGEWPQQVIDHIDGNPLNNKIQNLRDVSRRTNQENQRKAASSNKTTKLLGSSLNKSTGKYVSTIQVNKKTIYLGLFKTPEEAHQKYLQAKRELHQGATI